MAQQLSGYTVKELAKLLGKPEYYVRNRIARGSIKAKKSGWAVRIPKSEAKRLTK